MIVSMGVPFPDGWKTRSMTERIDGHATDFLRSDVVTDEREIKYSKREDCRSVTNPSRHSWSTAENTWFQV